MTCDNIMDTGRDVGRDSYRTQECHGDSSVTIGFGVFMLRQQCVVCVQALQDVAGLNVDK